MVVWLKANLFLQALVTVVAVSAHHRSGTFQGNSASATTGSATNMTAWFAQVCVQIQHRSSKHPLVRWQISLWRILRFSDVAAVWLDSSVRLLGWAVQSVGSCCVPRPAFQWERCSEESRGFPLKPWRVDQSVVIKSTINVCYYNSSSTKLFTYWSNDLVISCRVIQPIIQFLAQRCEIHYKTRWKTIDKRNA